MENAENDDTSFTFAVNQVKNEEEKNDKKKILRHIKKG